MVIWIPSVNEIDIRRAIDRLNLVYSKSIYTCRTAYSSWTNHVEQDAFGDRH